MKVVTVSRIDDKGFEKVFGTLRVAGGSIVADPPELIALVRRSMYVDQNRGWINPKREPLDYLRNMFKVYTGLYLLASQLEESER